MASVKVRYTENTYGSLTGSVGDNKPPCEVRCKQLFLLVWEEAHSFAFSRQNFPLKSVGHNLGETPRLPFPSDRFASRW